MPKRHSFFKHIYFHLFAQELQVSAGD